MAKDEQKLTPKQKRFLEVLDKYDGIVSNASKASKEVCRATHYRWFHTNETYKKRVELTRETLKDVIESALIKKIKSGDTAAVIFAAKTFCRDRGYSERYEVEHSTSTKKTETAAKWFVKQHALSTEQQISEET